MLLFNSQSASRIERLQESNLCGIRQLADQINTEVNTNLQGQGGHRCSGCSEGCVVLSGIKSQWDILTTDMDNLIKLTSC